MHWFYAIGARARFAEFRERVAEREASLAHGSRERYSGGHGRGGLRCDIMYRFPITFGRATTSLEGSQGHDVPLFTLALILDESLRRGRALLLISPAAVATRGGDVVQPRYYR